MPRPPIPTWWFALVVVRRADRFLVVQERKHGQLWYLPGGSVEPGERVCDAAVREALEESGVPVALEGILRVEHTPRADGSARIRVVFLAHPVDDTPPKQVPDDDTLGAAWVTLDELQSLPLRGEEVRDYFTHVAGGGAVHPLDLLVREGEPCARASVKTRPPESSHSSP